MKAKTKLNYIEDYPMDKIKPYGKNPRINDQAVPAVSASMDDFGNNDPIQITPEGIILAGHTRYKALTKKGVKTARVIVVEGLNDEEQKAYRLAHNKVGEIAEWDAPMVMEELGEIKNIDMEELGFDESRRPVFGQLEQMFEGETNEEYEAFVDKFEIKHTTDDCFTPEPVYNAILEWVRKKYGIPDDRPVVRPFYPGGDYQSENYPKDCIVIDNPPFSITAQIVDYYLENNIDFFIFCNGLTAMNNLNRSKLKLVLAQAQIIYENGANVNTAFYTNLGESRIMITHELHQIIEEVQPSTAKEVGAYDFPDNMIGSAMLARLAKYGTEMQINNVYVTNKIGGVEVYGRGGLVSDKMAEKLKAEKLKAEKLKAEKLKVPVILTDEEKAIIKRLNEAEE